MEEGQKSCLPFISEVEQANFSSGILTKAQQARRRARALPAQTHQSCQRDLPYHQSLQTELSLSSKEDDSFKAGLSSTELLISQQIKETVNSRLSLRKKSVPKIEEEGLKLRLINEDIGASSLSSGRWVNSSSSKQPLFQGPACFQGAGYNSSPSCVQISSDIFKKKNKIKKNKK